MIGKLLVRLSLVFVLATAGGIAVAQCPMCKISAETNLNNGGTAGKGLNKGILYLFATPYLIIGGIAYVWYRNKKQQREDDEVIMPVDAQLN